MDQSELIAQFCAVTAAEPELAEQYLSVADNNLESAITLFLESGGASIESQQRAASGDNGSDRENTTPETTTINSAHDDEEFVQRLQQEEYSRAAEEPVRERIRPVTERLVDPGFDPSFASRYLGGSSAPPRPSLPIGIFNQSMPSAFRQDDSDEDEDMISDGDDDIDRDSLLRETVGTSRLTAHESRLAALFRPPFDLIQNMDLDSATQKGIIEKKWILINIQDITEFSCQQLNRDLWSNKDVKTTVKANFIFLQYTTNDEAGTNYINYYPINKYPHIAILDPRTGERLKVWSEVPQSQVFIEEIHEFLIRFSLDPTHKNPIAKISRNKTDVQHMTEEEQIEMAVRQSLGVKAESSDDEDDFVSVHSDDMDEDDDIEVIETRVGGTSTDHPLASTQPQVGESSNSSNTRTTSDPSATIEIDSSDEHEEHEELTEEDIFASILPNKDPEPEADPKTTTRIQFRLADGTRIIRRFKLTDSVKAIFAFLKNNVEAVSGHYFGLTSDRKKLIEIVDETIESAKLQNSVVLVEILD